MSLNAMAASDMRDATVRQIFHLSAGGRSLRVHLSNAFGAEPLHFTGVHIARPVSSSSSAIDATTDRPLSFVGSVRSDHCEYICQTRLEPNRSTSQACTSRDQFRVRRRRSMPLRTGL